MIKLIKPSKEYFNQLIKLKHDFINNNESRIQGSGSLDKYENLDEWLKSINEIEQGLNSKLVPTTYYLILFDDEVVGTISMRNYLTKDLEEFGGHIGYSIKPSARRKGFATEALKVLLHLYKDKYDDILIMCEADNIASNKTVLANGGLLINQIEKFGLKINRFIIYEPTMPINNIKQPDIIEIDDSLRLLKYNGNYEEALTGYQDPYVYQNSEGIFDDDKKPDINYIKGMFEWLNNNGELYYIQIKEKEDYISIGDVTIKDVNPPITIWYKEYRGVGIGTKVMKTVIKRLKELGYEKITGTTVYKWNKSSQKMHEKLGFLKIDENADEFIYELTL